MQFIQEGDMSETAVTSFIIRFMQEQEPDQAHTTPWHGLIRHVQSSTETRFSQIEEALAFMNEYVDIAGSGETAVLEQE
jgi:oligoribonuclease (3'-5' exoribonuclease)